MELLPLLGVLNLLAIAEGLQCNLLNTIQGPSTMMCPGNVYECMKFVCDVNGGEEVFKGCNDLANPPISCVNLLTNCMARNGKGRCHTCTGDFCNSSPSLRGSLAISLITVTAVILIGGRA